MRNLYYNLQSYDFSRRAHVEELNKFHVWHFQIQIKQEDEWEEGEAALKSNFISTNTGWLLVVEWTNSMQIESMECIKF